MQLQGGHMQTFLFEYRHEGADWGLTIQARDAADAQERIKALAWARYQGQVFAKVPAAGGLFVRAAVWIRNIFSPS